MTENGATGEEPPKKAFLHIDDLQDAAGDEGMTLDRYQEVSDAIAEGRHDEYTDEERAEYDDHAQRMKELLHPLGKRLPKLFGELLSKPPTPREEIFSQKQFNPKQSTDLGERRFNSKTPTPAFSNEQLEQMARVRREKDAQDRAVADALRQIAEVTADEAGKNNKRYEDSELASQRRHKASMRVGWASAIAAVLAAAIAGFSVWIGMQNDPLPATPAPSQSQIQESHSS